MRLLKSSALRVIRQCGIPAGKLLVEIARSGAAEGAAERCVIQGPSLRVDIEGSSVAFDVRGNNWKGSSADFESAKAYLSAFEAALGKALLKGKGS